MAISENAKPINRCLAPGSRTEGMPNCTASAQRTKWRRASSRSSNNMSTNEARAFELVFEGRPVAWDRTGIGRDGRLHNRPKPLLHRRELAKAMRYAEGHRAFDGPVRLTVMFNYRRN